MKASSKRTLQNIGVVLATAVILALGLVGMYAVLKYTSLGEERNNVQAERQAAMEAEAAEDGSGAAEPQGSEQYSGSGLSEDEINSRTSQIVDGMTTKEKVSQLFFVSPETLMQVNAATDAGSYTAAYYDIYPVGGMIYGKKNLQSKSQVQKLLSNMQDYAQDSAAVPLLLGIVEEGGEVAPIANDGNFDVQKVSDAADTASDDDARANATTIGSYLSDLGFNVDIAPMADVSTSNGSYQQRTFASNPQDVSSRVIAQVQGYLSCDVLPCVKYFPGEGAVAGDPENESTQSQATVEDLREKDIVPFQEAIDAGAPMVMVGTTSFVEVSGDDTPACLSTKVVTGELRNTLGYEGVVLTAPLNTSAIYSDYTSGNAAVQAIQAGCDMIVEPMGFLDAYQAVLSAVQTGKISEERLDESVTRIVRMKLRLKGADEFLGKKGGSEGSSSDQTSATASGTSNTTGASGTSASSGTTSASAGKQD